MVYSGMSPVNAPEPEPVERPEIVRFSRAFASPAHADRARRLPTPFQLFRYMTGSEHLHFGLFESPDEPMATAQERNMRLLLQRVPAAPSRVLDVGCGIGGTSVALAERGHRVLGIAPEPPLIDYARALAADRGVAGRCEFRAARLQDLPADAGPFDVVLSQESLQYIHPLEEAMRRIAALTRPGGRVVVGDQVLRELRYRNLCQFHDSAGILAAAEAAGLRLVHHGDVTRQALHQVPVSLRILKHLRAEILEFFRPAHPDIEHHLDVCLRNGGVEGDYYWRGWIGYEHFAWDRPAQ